MAKLVKCKACGGDVATSAKACPKCGAPVTGGAGKKLFATLLIGAVVGTCAIAASRSSEEKAAKKAAVASGPVIDVAARTLASAYEANEVAADADYKGKVVLVTGIVDSINKDIGDDPVVILKANEMFSGVHCSMDDSQAGTAARLSKGQQVSMRGRVSGMILGSVMIKDCIVQ